MVRMVDVLRGADVVAYFHIQQTASNHCCVYKRSRLLLVRRFGNSADNALDLAVSFSIVGQLRLCNSVILGFDSIRCKRDAGVER